MSLDPLQCAACGAPVPLVDGDHGSCPSCGAEYPIPETYRALRDEAAANARRPEAIALAKALGKPPPLFIRAFAVFSSPLFIMFGLGFWLAIGVAASIEVMPWIGRHVFHVLSYDVLSDNRQMQLSLLVPIGALVIGFTVSSWARRNGIVRGGLQAALAAAPPAKPGGPKTCRQCAAPLAPPAGALAARCAYCQADNLVELPPAWIATMRSQAAKLEKEVRKAATAWDKERRALRRSLIKRSILWTLFLLLPLWFIFGAAAGKSESAPLPRAYVNRSPSKLPSWNAEMTYRLLDSFHCNEEHDGYRDTPACGDGRCAIYAVVPLRRGEVVRHQSSDLPAGSVVDLQMHDQGFLGDDWRTVATTAVSAGHEGTTEVPYSGWYRLRVTIPEPVGKEYWYCATVHGR